MERKLTAERKQEIKYDLAHPEEVGYSNEFMVSTLSDALHDLELAEAEIKELKLRTLISHPDRPMYHEILARMEIAEAEVERLRQLAAWRKAAIEMLIDCANNHAIDCECPRKAQAALEQR